MPKGKKKVVVDDVIIDNPEEVTIEEVTEYPVDYPIELQTTIEEVVNNPVAQAFLVDANIIETGKVNQGKKEYKNLETGRTYFE
jgi:hypothetical protein